MVKMTKPKKHLSNLEINAKYMKHREKIKNNFNALIKQIIQSLQYHFSPLKEQCELNEENEHLLNEKMAQLVELKSRMIDDWKDILGKDVGYEEVRDVDKILNSVINKG